MTAWRIGKKSYPIFSGEGARLIGGRWNSPGKPLIYAASAFSLSMLETLVHVQEAGLEDSFAFVEISISAEVPVEELDDRDIAADSIKARQYGDLWLSQGRSAVLIVPSVIVQTGDRNVLINPEHDQFALIKASQPKPVHWDSRLLQ